MSFPAVLLEEPYTVPQEAGASPYGREPGTAPDGGDIQGSAWNPDWRGETFVGADYQGFGGTDAFVTLGQPTDWDSYRGLVVSQPMIHGYAGNGLQEETMAELRSGSTIAFPANGQAEFAQSDPVLLEIAFDQGVDVGWQQWNDATRRMLFQEPPNYSAQTDPIPAAGWP